MKNRGLPEPLLWGSIEVASFVFLFLSPLLSDPFVEAGWFCLVGGRAAAIAGWLFLLSPAHSATLKQRTRGFGSSFMYSVPFWCSSFFFALRPGQEANVFQALTLYIGLSALAFALGFLKTHWLPTFLGALFFVSFGGLQDPFYYWPLVLSLGAVFLTRVSPNLEQGDGELRLLLLLGCGGLTFCLYLGLSAEGLGLRPMARGLTCWLLLSVMAGHLLGKARFEREERCAEREVELALPALAQGLVWNYRRIWLEVWVPWLSLFLLVLWHRSSLATAFAVIVALPGLWYLSGKGRVSENVLMWWCCTQFLILWGTVESGGIARLALLSIACFFSVCLWRLDEQPLSSAGLRLCPGQPTLEPTLRLGLAVKAPSSFSDLVLRSHCEPSVDLDEELTSQAPSGFRQRLLARLKETSDSEEGEE